MPVVESKLTAAAIGVVVPCLTSKKVVVLIVAGSIACENCAVTVDVVRTPLVPLAGDTAVTVTPAVPTTTLVFCIESNQVTCSFTSRCRST